MKYAENRTVPSTRYARMHWVPSRRRGFTFGGVFHLELLVELRANQYFASQIKGIITKTVTPLRIFALFELLILL